MEEENNINGTIEFFKEKILEISTPIKILHIGSNCRKKGQGEGCNYEKDFDIIIIVSDETDCYEYIKQTAPILRELIITFNITITAYPIKQSTYKDGNSEFLNNVRKDAVEIWTS